MTQQETPEKEKSENAKETPWQVSFPPDDKVTRHAKKSLIAACQGNERIACLLDHFLHSASWKVENLKLPTGKPVELTRSHDDLLARLPYQVSEHTLITYLAKLNEWKFVLSKKYGRSFTVQFAEVQEAINHPPTVEKKPRGRHAHKKKAESVKSSTFENNLQLSNVELLTKVEILEDKVSSLQQIVSNLQEYVEMLKLSHMPSSHSTSGSSGHFLDPTMYYYDSPSITEKDTYSDDADAHRTLASLSSDVEIEARDNVLTVVFDAYDAPDFFQVRELPVVKTWLNQSPQGDIHGNYRPDQYVSTHHHRSNGSGDAPSADGNSYRATRDELPSEEHAPTKAGGINTPPLSWVGEQGASNGHHHPAVNRPDQHAASPMLPVRNADQDSGADCQRSEEVQSGRDMPIVDVSLAPASLATNSRTVSPASSESASQCEIEAVAPNDGGGDGNASVRHDGTQSNQPSYSPGDSTKNETPAPEGEPPQTTRRRGSGTRKTDSPGTKPAKEATPKPAKVKLEVEITPEGRIVWERWCSIFKGKLALNASDAKAADDFAREIDPSAEQLNDCRKWHYVWNPKWYGKDGTTHGRVTLSDAWKNWSGFVASLEAPDDVNMEEAKQIARNGPQQAALLKRRPGGNPAPEEDQEWAAKYDRQYRRAAGGNR